MSGLVIGGLMFAAGVLVCTAIMVWHHRRVQCKLENFLSLEDLPEAYKHEKPSTGASKSKPRS